MGLVKRAAWVLGVVGWAACSASANELEGTDLQVGAAPKRGAGQGANGAADSAPNTPGNGNATVNDPTQPADPITVTVPPTPPPPSPSACSPGAQELCYSGPSATLGVGACRAGRKTCNIAGTAFGACVGETLPATEACGDFADNDCDGNVDEGCLSTLSLTKAGSGSGVVASSPAGINCGAACSAAFATGTSVTLTATPSPNHTYAWTGACTGSGACVVPMSQARNVGVTFTAPPACNGKKVSFTYTPSKSFYNATFAPACTATTVALQASAACAPSLVDLKINGTVGAAFLGQSAPGSVLTAYYSIAWPGAATPVSVVALTLAAVTNANCTVSVSLN